MLIVGLTIKSGIIFHSLQCQREFKRYFHAVEYGGEGRNSIGGEEIMQQEPASSWFF